LPIPTSHCSFAQPAGFALVPVLLSAIQNLASINTTICLHTVHAQKTIIDSFYQKLNMSYSDLQEGVYYLVRSENEDLIELVSVLMQTNSAVLLRSYLPEEEDFFVLKTDDIEVIEELDESVAEKFFDVYEEEEEIFNDEEIFEEESMNPESE
jgi:hypothetical protein